MSHRVLLVEDNEDTGAAMSMLLEHYGYEVLWTRSVGAALSLMQRVRQGEVAEADVVVLDLMLPDGSGADMIVGLMRGGPVPPVIVHSAAAEWVILDEARRLGAAATLRKPIDAATLLHAIEEAVQVSPAAEAM